MHSRPTGLHHEILILTKGRADGFKGEKKKRREWEERDYQYQIKIYP